VTEANLIELLSEKKEKALNLFQQLDEIRGFL